MDLVAGVAIVLFVVVALVIIVVVSRQAGQKRKHDHCANCGARLEIVQGGTTPVCQVCGRPQPWADDQLAGHGRG